MGRFVVLLAFGVVWVGCGGDANGPAGESVPDGEATAETPPPEASPSPQRKDASAKYTSDAGTLDLMVNADGVEVRYEAVFSESGAHCRCTFSGAPSEGGIYKLDDAGLQLVVEADRVRMQGPQPGCCGAIWQGDELRRMMDLPRCTVSASTANLFGQPAPGSETAHALSAGDEVEVLDPVFPVSTDYRFARKAGDVASPAGYLKLSALNCPEYIR